MGRLLERHALARVFGFEPISPWLPGATSAGLFVWQAAWPVAIPIALGTVLLILDENRKISAGLAEVHAWGFPVEGYRAWLLAETPAFDLELAREVSVELIAGSLGAVDSTSVVERRGERVLRVVMQRIAMEGSPNQPTFLVGDRRRLLEVFARVLAPLHAEVGIVAMRMGNADTLAALVAAPQTPASESSFRDPARAAPPELQSLVHAGTAHLRPPQEASTMRLRTARLLYASGLVPINGAGAALVGVGLILGGVIVGGLVGVPGVGLLLGTAGGLAGGLGARQRDEARLATSLAQLREYPFPIEGYDNWLLSGRPLLDVELSAPIPTEELEARVRASPMDILDVTLTWLTDRRFRLEIEPQLHAAGQGIRPFWGGSPQAFKALALRVLVPLHRRVPIVAVRMGGYLDRKA